jgi:hypothetical protein
MIEQKLLAHVYYYRDNHLAGTGFSCRGAIGAHMHFPLCSKADVALRMCSPHLILDSTKEIGMNICRNYR